VLSKRGAAMLTILAPQTSLVSPQELADIWSQAPPLAEAKTEHRIKVAPSPATSRPLPILDPDCGRFACVFRANPEMRPKRSRRSHLFSHRSRSARARRSPPFHLQDTVCASRGTKAHLMGGSPASTTPAPIRFADPTPPSNSSRSCVCLTHPSHPPIIQAHLIKYDDGDQEWHNLDALHKNGDLVWLDASGEPLPPARLPMARVRKQLCGMEVVSVGWFKAKG
jgi:hypothetical protein